MEQILKNMDTKNDLYKWFCDQCDTASKQIKADEDRERAQKLILSSFVKKIADIAMNDGLDSLLMLSKEIES
jgi:hypothetical protein